MQRLLRETVWDQLAAAAAQPINSDSYHHARDRSPIALATPEIRRLFNALLAAAIHRLAYSLHWSSWRCRHQSRARQAHYKRRLTIELSP